MSAQKANIVMRKFKQKMKFLQKAILALSCIAFGSAYADDLDGMIESMGKECSLGLRYKKCKVVAYTYVTTPYIAPKNRMERLATNMGETELLRTLDNIGCNNTLMGSHIKQIIDTAHKERARLKTDKEINDFGLLLYEKFKISLREYDKLSKKCESK